MVPEESDNEKQSEELDRWARIRAQFHELVDLPAGERATRLEELRQRNAQEASYLERLLASDSLEPVEPAPHSSVAAGERIGPYEVLKLIARGGMGEVLLARRADGEFEREVAIKLLLPGLAGEQLLQRFHRERQTLARLDHEYIAQLFDGGSTTEGRPYLVMEFVQGQPLDLYCERNALEIRERLELFMRVGAAVEHANESGVIHRDLKPSNILVRDDGSPRLLDFGIARSSAEQIEELAQSTPAGSRIFTPRYASPEQILGLAIDRRVDVYALGVVLYELLTGNSPYPVDESDRDLERAICEAPILPPSRVAKTGRAALAGDLDAILLRSLARDMEERYATVAEFCADIQLHLEHRPIRARASGPVQQAGKAVRRQPMRLVVAVAFLVILGLGWKARNGELLRIEQQRASAISILGTLARNREAGVVATARANLESARQLLNELDEDGLLRLQLGFEQAWVHIRERQYELGLGALSRVLDTGTAKEWSTPDGKYLRGLCLNVRSTTLHAIGRLEQARSAAEEGLLFARANAEAQPQVFVEALMSMAATIEDSDPAAGLALRVESVNIALSLPDTPGSYAGWVLIPYSRSLLTAGRYEEVVEIQRDILMRLQPALANASPVLGTAHRDLGYALEQLGEREQATFELTTARDILRLGGSDVTEIEEALERLGEDR